MKKIALPLAAIALVSLIAAAPSAPKYRESFLPPNNLQHRIGAKDTFVAYEPTLEQAILPQIDTIEEAARRLAAF